MLTYTLAFSQYNTKNFEVNIADISGNDSSFFFPFIEDVSWSVDVIVDTANISNGTYGYVDIMQSGNEEDRRNGISINFGSLNLFQLPAQIDSLSPLTIITDDNWRGKIFCIKLTKNTLSGDIDFKFIFAYNFLAVKQK